MLDLHGGIESKCAMRAQAFSQVGVLEVQEIGRVESADAFERVTNDSLLQLRLQRLTGVLEVAPATLLDNLWTSIANLRTKMFVVGVVLVLFLIIIFLDSPA